MNSLHHHMCCLFSVRISKQQVLHTVLFIHLYGNISTNIGKLISQYRGFMVSVLGEQKNKVIW